MPGHRLITRRVAGQEERDEDKLTVGSGDRSAALRGRRRGPEPPEGTLTNQNKPTLGPLRSNPICEIGSSGRLQTRPLSDQTMRRHLHANEGHGPPRANQGRDKVGIHQSDPPGISGHVTHLWSELYYFPVNRGHRRPIRG
ncbi:hypothetical protein Q8A67_020216 [Cirrhinus molitorella]|uniref:Uncharacterized protein n=1 Tax=Cirrhinus molitorella TaxID=172907 RepID=A0AA88P9W8_9TELE|nr:hypothetical protein Q8A67_020216 [Cirrhinus molitorella]